MTEPQAAFSETLSRPSRLKLGAAAGGALALAVGAAVAMGASPAPSASDDPSSGGTQPTEDHPGRFGFENFGGRFAFGGVTISAIDGSSLSLETEDGWTRTIEVADDTELTKDGEAIALGDLAVGDRIRFAQSRNDDGTYSIERIAVGLPTVAGEVTAVDGDSITVATADGRTVTIGVDGDTELVVAGDEAATIDDVEVGMLLIAAGEQTGDDTLQASRVRAGERLRGGPGHWNGFGPAGPGLPGADDPAQDGSSSEG